MILFQWREPAHIPSHFVNSFVNRHPRFLIHLKHTELRAYRALWALSGRTLQILRFEIKQKGGKSVGEGKWDKRQTILNLNKVIKPELRNVSHNFYPLQHFFPFPALHNLPVKYMYMLWTKWIHTMNKMNTYCEQNEYILWTAENHNNYLISA